MRGIRLGIIGLGIIGQTHLANALRLKNVRVTALCTSDPKRADAAAAANHCAAYCDYKDLLRDGVCDAVLIATPHYSHTQIGIDCLKAGLHVLVEKPISVHKADCQRLIAAHRNKKQIFAAMFNQRTDPRYRKLKQLMVEGHLGQLDRVTWIITDMFRSNAYYASAAWRGTWAGEGGGVLLNQCPHNLDLWQWIFGMPQRVRAFCKLGRKHNIEVEDDVTAYLDYDTGCSGVFIASTGEAPGTNRLEVAGEHGKVVIEGDNMRFIRNDVSANIFLTTTSELWSRPENWNIRIPVSGNGGQHAEILQNFIDAIRDGSPLIAPAAEGLKSVELANAMLYSSEMGKTVELPLDAKSYAALLKRKIKLVSCKTSSL